MKTLTSNKVFNNALIDSILTSHPQPPFTGQTKSSIDEFQLPSERYDSYRQGDRYFITNYTYLKY